MVILKILLLVLCFVSGVVFGYLKYHKINDILAKFLLKKLNKKIENELDTLENLFKQQN